MDRLSSEMRDCHFCLLQLLQFICGSKDKYRQLRDMHAVESHLQAVLKLCRDGGLGDGNITPHSIILPYDTLLSLVSTEWQGFIEVKSSYNDASHYTTQYTQWYTNALQYIIDDMI